VPTVVRLRYSLNFVTAVVFTSQNGLSPGSAVARSLAGIAGSNPDGGMDICFL
jgi:hypothetical protein